MALPGSLSSSNVYQVAAEHRAALLAREQATVDDTVRRWIASRHAIEQELDQLVNRVEAAKAAGKLPVVRPVASGLALGEKEYTASWLFRIGRMENLLQSIDTELAHYNQAGVAKIAARMKAEAIAGSKDATDLMKFSTGSPYVAAKQFAGMPSGAVNQLIAYTSARGPIPKAFNGMADQLRSQVQDRLVTGLAKGENPRVIGRRMKADTQDGGLLDVPLYTQVRVARTEPLRAYREAGRATFKANADVVLAWEWKAFPSNRTCPYCIAMDGSIHDLEEIMATHPQCRCTMLPVTELSEGSDLPGSQFLFEADWTDQDKILGGHTMGELYRKGEVRLEDIPEHFTHTEWGPSGRAASMKSLMQRGVITQDQIVAARESHTEVPLWIYPYKADSKLVAFFGKDTEAALAKAEAAAKADQEARDAAAAAEAAKLLPLTADAAQQLPNSVVGLADWKGMNALGASNKWDPLVDPEKRKDLAKKYGTKLLDQVLPKTVQSQFKKVATDAKFVSTEEKHVTVRMGAKALLDIIENKDGVLSTPRNFWLPHDAAAKLAGYEGSAIIDLELPAGSRYAIAGPKNYVATQLLPGAKLEMLSNELIATKQADGTVVQILHVKARLVDDGAAATKRILDPKFVGNVFTGEEASIKPAAYLTTEQAAASKAYIGTNGAFGSTNSLKASTQGADWETLVSGQKRYDALKAYGVGWQKKYLKDPKIAEELRFIVDAPVFVQTEDIKVAVNISATPLANSKQGDTITLRKGFYAKLDMEAAAKAQYSGDSIIELTVPSGMRAAFAKVGTEADHAVLLPGAKLKIESEGSEVVTLADGTKKTVNVIRATMVDDGATATKYMLTGDTTSEPLTGAKFVPKAVSAPPPPPAKAQAYAPKQALLPSKEKPTTAKAKATDVRAKQPADTQALRELSRLKKQTGDFMAGGKAYKSTSQYIDGFLRNNEILATQSAAIENTTITKHIAALDTDFQYTPEAGKEIVVYRGSAEIRKAATNGSATLDFGFSSTSLDRSVAQRFGPVCEVRIRAGDHFCPIDGYANDHGWSNQGEREMLLPRGTVFVPTGQKNANGEPIVIAVTQPAAQLSAEAAENFRRLK